MRELVVPVARGCPVGCSFCEVPTVFGKRERRLSITSTLTYIRKSFAAAPFDYVSFYAPTFTLDHAWVRALCGELRAAPVPWKCCTTIQTTSTISSSMIWAPLDASGSASESKRSRKTRIRTFHEPSARQKMISVV